MIGYDGKSKKVQCHILVHGRCLLVRNVWKYFCENCSLKHFWLCSLYSRLVTFFKMSLMSLKIGTQKCSEMFFAGSTDTIPISHLAHIFFYGLVNQFFLCQREE